MGDFGRHAGLAQTCVRLARRVAGSLPLADSSDLGAAGRYEGNPGHQGGDRAWTLAAPDPGGGGGRGSAARGTRPALGTTAGARGTGRPGRPRTHAVGSRGRSVGTLRATVVRQPSLHASLQTPPRRLGE